MSEQRVIDDAWRKGFARRSDVFETEVLPTARTWRWEAGVTWWEVRDAVEQAAWDLTEKEQRLLMLYLGRVNQDRLEERSDATCFPGEGWILPRLKCDPRTLRRCRQALEAKGWLVRDFNKANRPNGDEAIDLAPTFARFEELKARLAAMDQGLVDYRDAWRESALPPQAAPNSPLSAVPSEPGADSGEMARATVEDVLPGGQECPPKQSQIKGGIPVRERAQAARSNRQEAGPPAGRSQGARPSLDRRAREAEPRRSAGSDALVCFPRKAAARPAIPPEGSKLARRVREELQLALQASPRLATMVPRSVFDDPFSARAVDCGAVAKAAEQLLPQGKRNNGQTAIWGWERHGARVVAMLACAIENPLVVDQCRYFGAFVMAEGTKLDLRVNLLQIVRRQSEPAAAAPAAGEEAPGPMDPVWAAIAADLRPRVGETAWAAWFVQLQFRALENEVLILTTLTGTAARKIHEAYGAAIRASARAVGHPVVRLAVTQRARAPAT